MNSKNNSISCTKLNKITTKTNMNNYNDVYCFECHNQGDLINCDLCPRAYHSKCLNLHTTPEINWACPECEITQSSFNIINQSTLLQCHSMDELQIMLKYAFQRLKSHSQAEHFMQSIDLQKKPKYLDYIIHPMDLETIEKNLNQKKYNSTKAFFGDIKWILHNSIIYNGNQNKLTNIARTLVKIVRHEMIEIEICPECYLRSIQSISTDWFTKPCTIPHTLCWAKMKSYQPWPAKILRIVNNEIDVRFFGQHDRAWISFNNCFVLSKEYPGLEKKKSNINFEKSLIELQIHIEQIKKLYGHFTYAPLHTLISKTKPFKFVSIIDDSILPSYITAANISHIFELSSKCSNQQNLSPKINMKKSSKRSHKNSYEYQQSPKRMRISSKISNENNELQSTLNVFDILNQSEQILLPNKKNNEALSIHSKMRSSSPTDNKLRIQSLLKKYIKCKSPTIDPILSDVRLTINALLDAIEALKIISEVHILPINNQISEQCIRTKRPRKSNLQQHIIPKNTNPDLVTCSSLPFIPLRPLSASPSNIDIFESISPLINDNMSTDDQHQELQRTTSIEILNIKSESFDNEVHQQTQSFISTNSFLISPSLNTNTHLPIIIPNSQCIPQTSTTNQQNTIWPSVLSINSTIQQSKKTTHQRLRSSIYSPTSSNSFSMYESLQKRSNNIKQTYLTSNTSHISNQNSKQISQHTNPPLLDDDQTINGIQMLMNNFNNQFQQLLVDVTDQIKSSVEKTRLKYEKDLEEIHHSYHISLNELQSIASKQVQDIHNNLELQYSKRLSEMRHRYESKHQYQ